MMLLHISWRNIWRNKVRSLVIITAITLGIFAGVFSMAFTLGMVDQRIETIISTEVSHLQIHHKDFGTSSDPADHLEAGNQILAGIDTMQQVKGATGRLLINAMISSAETGTGIQLLGIDPDRERQVTDMYEHVIKGSYFKKNRKNAIVLGNKMAEKLNVKLRSKVILTFQDKEGNLTGGAFRVAGIYKTTNTAYEEMKAFVRKDDLIRLTGYPEGTFQEIAVRLKEQVPEEEVAAKLKQMYPKPIVQTWMELMPDMQMMNKSMDLSMYIIVGIILAALGFGIVNTMLMVVLERIKEIGMLMAVGMNKLRVFLMIMLETVFLSLTGGVTGIALALFLVKFTGNTGINLSFYSQGLEAYGFDSVIYPKIDVSTLFQVTVLVIFVGIIASIYPARKALKLNPAEALRSDN
ncbi:MAG: FtsX-like permease family protein [Bacteroidales bacterium]